MVSLFHFIRCNLYRKSKFHVTSNHLLPMFARFFCALIKIRLSERKKNSRFWYQSKIASLLFHIKPSNLFINFQPFYLRIALLLFYLPFSIYLKMNKKRSRERMYFNLKLKTFAFCWCFCIKTEIVLFIPLLY